MRLDRQNMIVGSIAAVVIIVAICIATWGVTLSNDDRDVRVKMACIAAHGVYVSGTCVVTK